MPAAGKKVLAPYRLLCLLYWSNSGSGIQHIGPGRVLMHSGPISRRLVVTYHAIYLYMKFLVENDFIKIVSHENGTYVIDLMAPPNFSAPTFGMETTDVK